MEILLGLVALVLLLLITLGIAGFCMGVVVNILSFFMRLGDAFIGGIVRLLTWPFRFVWRLIFPRKEEPDDEWEVTVSLKEESPASPPRRKIKLRPAPVKYHRNR